MHSSVLALLMDLELYISIPLSGGLSLELRGQPMQVREFVSAAAGCLASIACICALVICHGAICRNSVIFGQ